MSLCIQIHTAPSASNLILTDKILGKSIMIFNILVLKMSEQIWIFDVPINATMLKPLHTSACVVLRLAQAIGEKGMVSEALWGQRLLNECTSGAEERLRGQGRFENSFWRALLFHYSRDSLMKSLPLCPPAIQRLCMLIANKACTSL